MQIERLGQPLWQTIGVLEFSPDGVEPRLYYADPGMPALTVAMDPADMRRRFTNVLDGNGSSPIEDVDVDPIRYKPGLHCVYRYQLKTPHGVRVWYGKMFAHDSDSLMESITALHQASLDIPEMPRVPEPLVYWPDIHLLVQPAVAEGIEFTKFAYDTTQEESVREVWMRRAGASLAAFHSCGVPGTLRSLQDDVDDLLEYLAPMEKVKPQLAERFESVIEDIVQRASKLAEPEPVPSHGAMRTDQFLLQGDELAMIDLDGFCWSNPARDIGNFLAYLCWKAIRQPEHGSYVENAGRIFLDGYLESRPYLDPRWLSIYQAASLLKIAGRRFRNLNYKEWPLIIHLIDAAVSTLQQDWSSLDPEAISDWRGTLFSYLSTSTSLTKFPATFIDKEFPALWGALNTEMMTNDLAPVLASLACSDPNPVVERARLLAYKPGKRGVIRYDLVGPGCSTTPIVLGKIYPELFYCERAYWIMKVLWEDVFHNVPDLKVPQPLGIIPQLSMLVFLPSEGQFLGEYIAKNRMDSPQTYRLMDLAGTWLANLHNHYIPLEKEFKIEGEIDNIQEWVGIISLKYPEEAKAALTIAEYLLRRASELNFENTVPIHKDFHYEHIMVDGGINVFDFDEIRRGDPNIDLAHFCANFYLLAYRNQHHTAHFSNLQNHFFASYAKETGWNMGERFLYFYAFTCLKIAKQLCKKRGPRPWPEGEEQRAQVWLMLEQGLSTVAQARAKHMTQVTDLPLVEFSRIRRSGWLKAGRISKSDTSSEAIHVSHKHLS
jgi:aminoglycoside phosphotransferase (APT) family kinase protein